MSDFNSTSAPRGPIMPPEFNSTSSPTISAPPYLPRQTTAPAFTMTPMTRPDATLDQLRTLIDVANERHLHDAEQWLRERVEAAERLMLHGLGVLTTKTLSEVLGLTPEQEAERVAALNEALSRIRDMERGR